MRPTSDRLIAGAADWGSLRDDFRWPEPEHFNIAQAVCEKWANSDPDRIALIHPRDGREDKSYSFGELSRLSDKFAAVLKSDGFYRGDHLAILLPQAPETVIAHLATYKLAGVVVPLFTLFGEDGLRYRLKDSGAKIVVTDAANLPKVLNIADDLPALEQILCIDGSDGVRDFWGAVLAQKGAIEHEVTGPDTPALLVYTSGTTGPPKGALHAQRVLLGHLPGVETHHEFFPQEGDLMWTPADWAWLGGLMNALMPALYFGVPVVAHRLSKFDPQAAYDLMVTHSVRNVFFPPTALRLLLQVDPPPGLSLRTVGSGGETLGAELLEVGRDKLGLTINEFYGTTECNLVIGNCSSVFEPKLGSMGKAVPGSEVAVIDENGAELPVGELGQLAVKRGDRAMFLEYWLQPEKTAEKFVGDWLLTGDEGYIDADGYFFFSSRSDDVITSAGYRIGPSEIEECLLGHEAVSLAAAIGEPDPDRGERVKAFVVLQPGCAIEELEAELIERVRTRISPHVAPKSIVAIDELPVTATGKIMRRELKGR